MKSLPVAALALASLVQPLFAQQPVLRDVKDIALAEAEVRTAVSKAPEHLKMVGGAPIEFAPLFMFLPYAAEFDEVNGLKLENLEDARLISNLRFKYWEVVAEVLSEEAARLEAEQKDLKEDSIPAEPISGRLKRMQETVRIQGAARLARMIAADAAADLKAVSSIESLEDKPLLKKIGAEVLERKSRLFSALSGAEKNGSVSGR